MKNVKCNIFYFLYHGYGSLVNQNFPLYDARIKGFFGRNYSKKQIIIDRENFNTAVVYPLAKKVFGKNFSKNALAQSLYDDMIQEAVIRMFELSGKTKEIANRKYSEKYAAFWIAHNASLPS